ncbi:MAG: neutral/alkaline non-lysosomal ceramidase N-terminal domain-containing protein [Clostridia bacterium]|nr:neutral/alkaline non-lysosomal ceramidase N-terminal domain-containing protein [Clostridia bacterium]
MSDKLLLGVSRAIITPEVGCALSGYRPDLYSESVNDDLTATVLVFSQNGTTAMLITATVSCVRTSLDREVREKISESTGVKFENIILCATHTHSGPNTLGTAGWGTVDRHYVDTVFIPQILVAAREACESLVSVRVGYAQGESYVGINRREMRADNTIALGQNPQGAMNPNMTVISFRSENGESIANLIHYGCHGTASGANREITRDWSGVMMDVVERDFGGITAFINGPEGDVGPRLTNGRTTGGGNISYALELGGYAARDAMTVAQKIKAYRNEDISVFAGEIKIPLKPRMPYDRAKSEYEKYKDCTSGSDGLYRELCRMTAESYEKGEADAEYRAFSQTIIRIGDIAIVSFPFELFCEIGIRIDTYCKEIPYVLSLSNANGSESYFPTEEQKCRGGYETKICDLRHTQPYSENADYALVTETLENLKKVM